MKLIVKHQTFFEQITIYFATLIRLLLNVLLVVVVGAIVVGVSKSGYDLLHSLHKPLGAILQDILLDVVFIVALIEISITILGYLKDGYVHVRYIVDTILIIMLNEIVSLWFRPPAPSLATAGSLSITILALAAVRVVVTRLEPKTPDD